MSVWIRPLPVDLPVVGLAHNSGQSQHSNIRNLTKQFQELVNKYTDWSQRADIKAEVKGELIILLGEKGYPPVDRDEVYKEIFEQAESLASRLSRSRS